MTEKQKNLLATLRILDNDIEELELNEDLPDDIWFEKLNELEWERERILLELDELRDE